MSEREFNPINPFELDEDEYGAYFDRLNEARWLIPHQTPNMYRGSQRLYELVGSKTLGVGVVIRVNMFDSGDDWFFMITPEGLVNYLKEDKKPRTPEEILDNYGQPIWEIVAQDVFVPS